MQVVRDSQVSTIELSLFFLLTIIVSATWVLLSGDYVEPGVGPQASQEWFRGHALVIIWAPMTSALLVSLLFRGKDGLLRLITRLDPRGIGWRWWLTAAVLPVLIHVTALALTDSFVTLSRVDLGAIWISNFWFICLIMIGEEAGWRGYALPALQARVSVFIASLLLGVLWGVWHYPVWFGLFLGITGDPMQAALVTLVNTVSIVGLAFLFSWLANNTRASIALAMVFHGANNASLRLYSESSGFSAHLTSYVLVILVATILVLAYREDFLSAPRAG